MNLEALIFDFDGTLADTMPAHYVAWRTTLAKYGLEFSENRFYALGGWPSWKIIEMLAREKNVSLDVMAISHEKEEEFLKSLHLIEPIEFVANEVRSNRDKLKMAVATGAIRPVLDLGLVQIGMADVFPVLVTAEEVEHHKPAPDVFLEAARRLGVSPAACRVYEDSDPGVEAARRAGMSCVDIRAFHTPRRITPIG